MRSRNRTARLAASLHRHLQPVSLSGLTAREATTMLTYQTAEWARKHWWTVTFEAPARVSRPTRRGPYRGRLDLLCTSWFRRPIAIEIDRANKMWSLDKLQAEADAGASTLWVRWAGDQMIEVPAGIGLVDIRHSAGWKSAP
ncbi:hypothetical protein ACIP5Y_07630 [Nocardia sp. NPDC088792]|uniref:hypothetical protein n=1 Tax=Nocardia sp. NPDC088792 TaxID=3364332 RepID=UPI00382E39E4